MQNNVQSSESMQSLEEFKPIAQKDVAQESRVCPKNSEKKDLRIQP